MSEQENQTAAIDGLVGRQTDAESLRRLVAERRSLVTVRGAPGVGKSHLAARLLEARAERPVIDCHLRGVETIDGLHTAVARALDLPLNDPLDERIELALQGRSAPILLLDDADGLTGRDETRRSLVDWLDELGRAVPELTVVLTSRRRLETPEEHCLDLAPLTTAQAVELFEQTARRVRSGFTVDETNRPAVERLVVQVDRLPQAVELAASRVRILAPGQLADRLEAAGSDDPTASSDLLAPLHRTLTEWWETLPAWARETSRQLTAFRGRFPADAAEAILDLPAQAPNLLDALEHLVDCSILETRDTADRTQIDFHMLRTLRQFVASRSGGADPATLRRHADYFAGRVDTWWRRRIGPGAPEARRARDRSVDELEAAFDRAVDRGAPVAAALGVGLMNHATDHSRYAMAERVSDRLAEADVTPATDTIAARLAFARAYLHASHGELEAALRLAERAVDAAESAGDAILTTRVDSLVAQVQLAGGDPQAARARLEDSLDRLDQTDAVGPRVRTLIQLGRLHRVDSEDTRAEAYIRDALDRARRHDLPEREMRARLHLGLLYADLEQFDRALQHLEAAAEINDERLDWGRSSMVPGLVGSVYHRAGQLDPAKSLFEQSVEAKRREGDLMHLTDVLADYGLLLLEREEPGEARQAFLEARRRARSSHLGNGYDLIGGCHLGVAVSYLLEGRRAAADEAFAEVDARLEAISHRQPARDLLPAMVAHGRALAAALRGDDEGERRAVELLADAPDLDSTNAGYLTLHRLTLRHSPDEDPANAPTDEPPPAGPTLKIGRQGDQIRLDDGSDRDLSRRAALRRILHALVDAHRQTPDGEPAAPLSVYDLLEAGWPDQTPEVESGKSRVYTTVGRLRDLGLEELLETVDGGYRLRADLTVVDGLS